MATSASVESDEDEFFGAESELEDSLTEASTSSQPPSKRNSFFGDLNHVSPPHDASAASYPIDSSARRSSQGLPRGARLAQTALELTASSAPPATFQPPPRQSSVPAPPRRPPKGPCSGMEEPPSARERTLSVPQASTASDGRRSSFYGLDGHTAAHARPQPIARRRSSFTTSASGSWSRRSHMPEISSTSRTLSMASSSPSVLNLELTPPSPAIPLLDHSHLHVGAKASLLSHAKTLELYRANAKKTNDPDVTFEFAQLMISVSKDLGDEGNEEEVAATDAQLLDASSRQKDRRSSFNLTRKRGSPSSSSSSIFRASSHSEILDAANNLPSASSSETDLPHTKRNNLLREASALLRKLAHNGHVPSQFLLGELYAEGVLSAKGRHEHERAFPWFVLAAKHGHTESAFRTAQCCEHALGCRRDAAKAVQWYKKACADSHPEAMFRLGMAEIKGELSLQGRQKEGFKWLKRAAELADQPDCPPSSVEALFELGMLHVKGIEHVVFVDADYAAECWARASELGHAKSAFTLGECYEYGRMGLPQDSALSIHYYNIAAQQEHPEACFALTAWYLIGSPGVLPQSDTEAYLWAKRAASQALPKAEYAVGYFSETGMGTPKDLTEAMMWYRKASEHGDPRATARLKGPQPVTPLGPRSNSLGRYGADSHPRHDRSSLRKAKTDSDCIIS